MHLPSKQPIQTNLAENLKPEDVFSFDHIHGRYRAMAFDLATRILKNRIGGMRMQAVNEHRMDIFDNHVGAAINEAFWSRMNIREIHKGVRARITEGQDTGDVKIITTTEMLNTLDQKLLHELLSGSLAKTGHHKGMDESTAMSRLLDVSEDDYRANVQKAECLELLRLDLFWRELNLANRSILQAQK